jgi:chromate reductase, NAD(P)H dehydrogenase (quinone)
MRVLAISGSLRRDSHNTTLLRAAADELPSPAEVEFFEGLREIPPYDQDDDVEPAPVAVQRLREAIASADAILFATPEYNASIPGVLKNAVDWASRPKGAASLLGKPVAVIGASTGSFGAVWAQSDLRRVLSTAGARVLDRELPVAKADDAFDESGRLVDHELNQQLEEILAELVSEAEQDLAIREQRVAA